MDRTIIYVLDIEPYRNYIDTMLYNNVKIAFWDELIIQYPMT